VERKAGDRNHFSEDLLSEGKTGKLF